MLYGLYLSASGVMTSAYRQDVIANNLANSETVGFKKDLALFMERRTAAQENGASAQSNRLLENLGGGLLAAPTTVDTSQGELEPTGNNLDLAIVGDGYFAVSQNKQTMLTRNGQFAINRKGRLSLASDQSVEVLDNRQRPITIDTRQGVLVARDGTIKQNGQVVAQIGLFDVPDRRLITKQGGTMLSYPDMKKLRAAPVSTVVRGEFIERANVDPTTELAALMDAQRQLEANANMIRYQDQMLSKLVNEVGKIS